MGFISFTGRVFFASIFILSAWQMYNDFGVDGGPAAKEYAIKLATVKKYLASQFGEGIANFDVKLLVAAAIFNKALGGILFVFGSTFGAFLLLIQLALTTPVLSDFYNYKYGEPNYFALLQEFLQSVALVGALLFFLGMKYAIPRKQLRKKTTKTKTG